MGKRARPDPEVAGEEGDRQEDQEEDWSPQRFAY